MEVRLKGSGFMQRIKERWDGEYPSRRHITAQNLCENVRRFKKERIVKTEGQQGGECTDNVRNEKNVQWQTEMKVRLVEIDLEEREEGRGFMNRVKERWDMEFPAYVKVGAQRLRDNASRFKTEKEIYNLVMIRKRGEGSCGEGELNLGKIEENYRERHGESAIGMDTQLMDEIGEEMMNGTKES